MKRCHYCGKEYADDVTVCPVDGQRITNSLAEGRKRVALQSAFNARLVSSIASSGKYRIFARGSDLIFIRLEGETHSALNSLHSLLGPLGAVPMLVVWLFSRHKAKDFNRRLEGAEPEDLIRDSEKNFRLHLSEIRDAVMEPPAFWQLSGKQAGRLDLSIRQGEKMKLEFETPDELEAARQLLTPLLPSTLRVNVEWDEAKQRFQKKKTHTPA